MKWTNEQLKNLSPAAKLRNPELFGVMTPKIEPAYVPKPPKRLRQDSNPLMNKLEAEAFEWLKDKFPGGPIRPQSKRYKLGNGIWYKPDFTYSDAEYGEMAWEVKGPHAFRGGFENLKVAASVWREVKWTLIWKVDGQWHEQEILP